MFLRKACWCDPPPPQKKKKPPTKRRRRRRRWAANVGPETAECSTRCLALPTAAMRLEKLLQLPAACNLKTKPHSDLVFGVAERKRGRAQILLTGQDEAAAEWKRFVGATRGPGPTDRSQVIRRMTRGRGNRSATQPAATEPTPPAG